MSLNPFSDWRSKLFRVLNLIAPEGSSLDAVFGSYSDWQKFRPKGVSARPQSGQAGPAAKPEA